MATFELLPPVWWELLSATPLMFLKHPYILAEIVPSPFLPFVLLQDLESAILQGLFHRMEKRIRGKIRVIRVLIKVSGKQEYYNFCWSTNNTSEKCLVRSQIQIDNSSLVYYVIVNPPFLSLWIHWLLGFCQMLTSLCKVATVYQSYYLVLLPLWH